MKKKILITMLAVIMLTIFSVTAFALSLGDVNGDGKSTAADARLALRYSAKIEVLSEEQIAAADVDKSGTVNAADARTILRVSAKLEVSFEDRNLDEHLIEDGVLHVAVAEDSKPFSYTENGELKGIDVELAQKIAETASLELMLHPMPYEDMINAVSNGECDLAAINNRDNDVAYETCLTDVYYSNRLSVVVRDSSGYDSIETLKNDSTAKYGVLNNSIDKYMVENEVGENHVIGYDTCAQMTDALYAGDIDAFVANYRYTWRVQSEFGDLVELNFYFISDDHLFITEDDNIILARKINAILTDSAINKCIEKYNSYIMNSKLVLKRSSVTVAPGSTVCIEVDAESFFFTEPHILVGMENGSAQIENVNGKQYLVLFTYSDTPSQQVEVYLPDEKAKCLIDLKLSTSATKNYIITDNVGIPDFGAYTKTGVSNAILDEATGIIAYTYSAEDLYNNGITDTSMLEGYFNALEKAGFEYVGYMGDDTYFVASYYNEKQGKVFSYAESYYSNGYIQEIGIGFNLFKIS